MTLTYISQSVLTAAYWLLPAEMSSDEATAYLLAIGLQESGFTHRRQVSGPARGFWQFERAGIAGILSHPTTRPHIERCLADLCYQPTVDACHAGVEHNDVLAAVFARLLLWTLPDELPRDDESEMAWQQYLRAWRPGRPHYSRWASNYSAAWTHVELS